MRKIQFLIVFILALNGCATATYPEVNSVDIEPPPVDKAKILFTRDNSILYMALGARVKVEGTQVAKLARRESFSTLVTPGKVKMEVDTATAPGRFGITLNASAGKIYQIKVLPRNDSFLPGALFGILGSAADASVNEQSGLFMFELVSVSDGNAVSSAPAIVQAPTSADKQPAPHAEVEATAPKNLQNEIKENSADLQAPSPEAKKEKPVTKGENSLDRASGKCSELGYEKGTEKYADCSLKLLDEFKQPEYQ
jgi:hypothetical protein